MMFLKHYLHPIKCLPAYKGRDPVLIPNVCVFIYTNIFLVLEDLPKRIFVKWIPSKGTKSFLVECGVYAHSRLPCGILPKDALHNRAGCRINFKALVRPLAQPKHSLTQRLPL